MEKRKTWVAPIVLALILAISIAWGYNQYAIRQEYEIGLSNHYQRLFHDVKDSVEKVQIGLSKSMVASTIDRNILLFSQIMNDANFAQDKLAQLPISHEDIGGTKKFLTQAADYSYYLIQRHLDGEDITDEQRKTLASLQNNSREFNNELAMLQETMANMNIMNMSTNLIGIRTKGKPEDSPIHTSLTGLEEEMGKTPELLYDGPFADQMINKKPQGLPNEDVSQAKAATIARDFYGKENDIRTEAFQEGDGIDDLRMPSHTFHLFPRGRNKEAPVYIGVSQKGGKVVWMADPRPIDDPTISIKEGQQKALDFLRERGFDNMEPNYYLQSDGSVLYNFAAKEKDIVLYPDLVKVKVALDNGGIVGFDASPYYMNHHKRDYPNPSISMADARKKLRDRFKVDSERLALIPKGKDEALCYEFKGKQDHGEFIIYINASNGKEEQILQIIENENGTLTF